MLLLIIQNSQKSNRTLVATGALLGTTHLGSKVHHSPALHLDMPNMTIIRNSTGGGESTMKGESTFTGNVWLNRAFVGEDLSMANVTFTPCARTHWQTHEKGQVLHVLVGSGWVCDKGGREQRIKAGDLVYAPPGTTHWHGADDGTVMTHLAIRFGKATWHDAVTDEEYNERGSEMSA